MTETVDGKMMTNEFFGLSCRCVFHDEHGSWEFGVTNAMAAGLVLVVMMMTLSAPISRGSPLVE